MKNILIALILCAAGNVDAGRPVYHTLDLKELISNSQFIFKGIPTSKSPNRECKDAKYLWEVQKVLKGEKSLEGNVVAIAFDNYRMYKERPVPSFAANKYKNGFDMKARQTILFTKPNSDGCYELSARGAQEELEKEKQIQTLINCEKGPCK